MDIPSHFDGTVQLEEESLCFDDVQKFLGNLLYISDGYDCCCSNRLIFKTDYLLNDSIFNVLLINFHFIFFFNLLDNDSIMNVTENVNFSADYYSVENELEIGEIGS